MYALRQRVLSVTLAWITTIIITVSVHLSSVTNYDHCSSNHSWTWVECIHGLDWIGIGLILKMQLERIGLDWVQCRANSVRCSFKIRRSKYTSTSLPVDTAHINCYFSTEVLARAIQRLSNTRRSCSICGRHSTQSKCDFSSVGRMWPMQDHKFLHWIWKQLKSSYEDSELDWLNTLSAFLCMLYIFTLWVNVVH